MDINKNGVVTNNEINEYCLPPEYQEVEYIENTNSDYIELNFGFTPTDESYAIMSLNTSQTFEDMHAISTKTWNTKGRYAMGISYNKYNSGYGATGTGSTYLEPETTNNGEKHQWHYNNKKFKIIDLNISKDVSSINFNITETSNICLFYNGLHYTKAKIYNYKHYKNGIIKANLIPCYRKSDSIIGMYDTVTKMFFTNSGTGTFTKGNDIEHARFYEDKIKANNFIEI